MQHHRHISRDFLIFTRRKKILQLLGVNEGVETDNRPMPGDVRYLTRYLMDMNDVRIVASVWKMGV